jgi:hypothetical protein
MTDLEKIGWQLRTQDNRMTQNPMFCVQVKRRDVGYDSDYATHRCWHDAENDVTIYDDDIDFAGEPDGDQWDEFGFVDRWETVTVSFTEAGCEEYIRLDGHNLPKERRIYVQSFNRNPEMIAIREALLNNKL